MSTVSYLRVQLTQAERRLARFRARQAEADAAVEADPTPRNRRKAMAIATDPAFASTRAAVDNLQRALKREEARLIGDPAARL